MNPELMRNLWLELTPRRMILMVLALGFIFVTAWISSDNRLKGPAQAGEMFFYVIVILWGTRNAAQAVVGEIRDRTWDLQRLSAIGPWDMVWGKLFGSTSYVWFGGALCLLPVIAQAVTEKGLGAALMQLAFYLSIGLVAHGSALLASLVAVRRRMSHSRLDVFLYQIVGLLAAGQVWAVWATAVPSIMGLPGFAQGTVQTVVWYGMTFGAASFYLVSLAVFSGWILAGTHQFMRQELQVKMNPLVWIAFLIFIAGYTAGFAGLWDRPSTQNTPFADIGNAARWFIAGGVLAFATYVSLFAMPKERVRMRWLMAQAGAGRIGTLLWNLPGWTYAFTGTAVCLFLLLGEIQTTADEAGLTSDKLDLARWLIIAILGEIARNIGIVMAFNMLPAQRRGDFAALVTLALLYWAGAAFITGAQWTAGLGLISPWLAPDHAQVSAVAMWVQAAIVWVIAVQRLISGHWAAMPAKA